MNILKTQIAPVLFIILLSANAVHAKDDDVWFAFVDKKNELIGFKDKTGRIRIPPRFMGITGAIKFRNIISVMEEVNGKYATYYLLKNGKKVGTDKVFIDGDNYLDCESEGMIRFHDRKSDMIGFYNSNGEEAIPAVYNTAEPFRNGMAWVIQGAEKECPGNHSRNNDCEHWGWKGGKHSLIDRNNNVIIEHFQYHSNLDWYSLQITGEPSSNPLMESFKGRDDKFYNFINMEKEFEEWLTSEFLSDLNIDTLTLSSARKITYWNEGKGWLAQKKEAFIKRNQKILLSELSSLNDPKTEYAIFPEELMGFQYAGDNKEDYFDDCGRSKVWQYPVFSVVINRVSDKGNYQNHFNFLRTKKGYRLFSVSVGND